MLRPVWSLILLLLALANSTFASADEFKETRFSGAADSWAYRNFAFGGNKGCCYAFAASEIAAYNHCERLGLDHSSEGLYAKSSRMSNGTADAVVARVVIETNLNNKIDTILHDLEMDVTPPVLICGKIVGAIRQGRPCMLLLRGKMDGKVVGHAVVCYACFHKDNASAWRLAIEDSNSPRDIRVLNCVEDGIGRWAYNYDCWKDGVSVGVCMASDPVFEKVEASLFPPTQAVGHPAPTEVKLRFTNNAPFAVTLHLSWHNAANGWRSGDWNCPGGETHFLALNDGTQITADAIKHWGEGGGSNWRSDKKDDVISVLGEGGGCYQFSYSSPKDASPPLVVHTSSLYLGQGVNAAGLPISDRVSVLSVDDQMTIHCDRTIRIGDSPPQLGYEVTFSLRNGKPFGPPRIANVRQLGQHALVDLQIVDMSQPSRSITIREQWNDGSQMVRQWGRVFVSEYHITPIQ